MMFADLVSELTAIIKKSYEEGVTTEEAERLAGRFLHAQILVASELRQADLDSRMKKQGTKAIKAAVYLQEVQAVEKKPSDVLLQAKVDSNELVAGEQTAYDESEVHKDELQNFLNVCKESHIHFRGIAKGQFGG